MAITCPLTNSPNTKLERCINTSYIINEWKRPSSNIDVSRFFIGLEKIYVYKCLDTGYRFFYPFTLEGDDRFYNDLQKFKWYYMDEKWEYEKVAAMVKPGQKVLEIGCGQGDFLEKCQSEGAQAIGLEFNSVAIKKCQSKNLTVKKELIQNHTKNNQEKYDIVCSFQVMEHISRIRDAIQASLDVLRSGGLLIISVPNNGSFLKKDHNNLLNIPPHHVGLWDKESLENLEKIFPVKLQKIYYEPLQSYHYRYYYKVRFGRTIDKIFGKKIGYLLNKILGRISLHYLVKNYYPKWIKGHTIMAVYKKS